MAEPFLSADQTHQRAAVRALVEMARAEIHGDLRANQRFPFFQPVTVTADEEGTVSLSAFSRDISESGMGLLTYWPLSRRWVRLRVHLGDDEELTLVGQVQWCEGCGHGWYVAGVSFSGDGGDDFSYADGIGQLPG